MNKTPPKSSILDRARVKQDDLTLIKRCCAGDNVAFKELVERYQRKIYGTAFGMLHNVDDAMDVTQEAFIKVHSYLTHFKGQSSFFTWLYRITINLCIDHLRKGGKNQAVDYEDAIEHELDRNISDLLSNTADMHPGRALARKEINTLLYKGLQELSPNHRAILLMREVDGLSYTEMAEVMQCTVGTIMSRLFHARRHMQEALKELVGEKDLTSDDWQ